MLDPIAQDWKTGRGDRIIITRSHRVLVRHRFDHTYSVDFQCQTHERAVYIACFIISHPLT